MTRAVGDTAPRRRPRTADAGSLEERALCQAGRELLLAQDSDWPFIITNGTTEEYARRRFNEHLNRFHELLNTFEHGNIDTPELETLEYWTRSSRKWTTACSPPRKEPLALIPARQVVDAGRQPPGSMGPRAFALPHPSLALRHSPSVIGHCAVLP